MSAIGNKEILSRNLKYYIEKSGKDRRELAEIWGFPYSTITEWINGRKYPRIDRIEIMADYFGILKSDLIESKADSSAVEIPASLSEAHQKILEITKTLTESEAYQALQTLNLIVKGLRK